MSALLRAEAVSFGYGSHAVFDRYTAAFEPGLTWVRGRNGSGKSTLLELLGGLLEPRAGRIVLAGADAAAGTLEHRRRVYWCGPEPLPLPHLTGLELLGLTRSLYPSFDASEFDRHLDGLSLRSAVGRPLGELSTGVQRKVWLLCALLAQTEVVLLDEPCANLDAAAVAYLGSCLGLQAASSLRAWVVASHERPADSPLVRCLDL